MARIELLLLTLVFGLVYSAPFNVSSSSEAPSFNSSSPASSSVDPGLNSSSTPESRSLPPWVHRVPPRRSSVSPFSIRPIRQEVSSSSLSPLDEKPGLSNGSLSRDNNEEKIVIPSDKDVQAGIPSSSEAPVGHPIRHVVRSLPDGDGVSPKPEDSQSGGRRPLPLLPYRGPVSSSQQPDNSSTQSPSSVAVSSDSGIRLRPVPHVYVGPASRGSSAIPSSSESASSYGNQSSSVGPQNATSEQPSQRPFLVQRDVASLPYGIPSRSGDDDSDSPDERNYPVIAEEVAEVAAVVPQGRYPPVLISEVSVPSVIPSQDASPYDAAQIVPLSVEPVSEEPSEESSDDPPQQSY